MTSTIEIACPECGAPMVLRQTSRFTYRNGDPRRFWGCSRYPACSAVHGAHPDGRPLGVPGDAETKAARIAAHEAFDRLWKGRGPMNRTEAYRWLRRAMNLTIADAHIGRFDAGQCRRLVELVERRIGGQP